MIDLLNAFQALSIERDGKYFVKNISLLFPLSYTTFLLYVPKFYEFNLMVQIMLPLSLSILLTIWSFFLYIFYCIINLSDRINILVAFFVPIYFIFGTIFFLEIIGIKTNFIFFFALLCAISFATIIGFLFVEKLIQWITKYKDNKNKVQEADDEYNKDKC